MSVVDLARDLMASGLAARVFVTGAAALVVASILMAVARQRFAGRVMGRALAATGLVLLVPTALVGTVARVAAPEPAIVYSPCANDGELPPLPPAPPAGCVLAVEWDSPGAEPSCGLVVTGGAVRLPEGTRGRWWYQSPLAAQQHVAEYQAAHPECALVDQR